MKQDRCGWAYVGMRVVILRLDIKALDKRNKNREGLITKIDGEYIYVSPLYEKKRLLELYLNEISPLKGEMYIKEEYVLKSINMDNKKQKKETDKKQSISKKSDLESVADAVVWKKEPEEHDYPAASDYLELLFSEKKVRKIVLELRKSKMTQKKAKDILRASRLPLLGEDNIHVKKNISKVKSGEKLSPVLLVRSDNGLVIADGYHRVCAIYYLSEDLVIPCKLV